MLTLVIMIAALCSPVFAGIFGGVFLGLVVLAAKKHNVVEAKEVE